MDLDSWKPNDVYRRISVAVNVQIAIFVGVALVMGIAWPWWLGWPLGIALGASLHFAALRAYDARRRRRPSR